MKAETIGALFSLGERLYVDQAAEFSRTRSRPWPGFDRILARASAFDPLSILDAGCGNARFAVHAKRSLGRAIDYVGLDASDEMLREARQSDLGGATLIRFELGRAPLSSVLGTRTFALAVAFGLLHHIPSLEIRSALVRALAERVAPGGMLALAFWRFAQSERFRSKLADWSEAPGAIDTSDLEPGDHLLRFAGRSLRYCHFSDAEEIDALTSLPGFSRIDDFESDGAAGDLNRYVVLSRAR